MVFLMTCPSLHTGSTLFFFIFPLLHIPLISYFLQICYSTLSCPKFTFISFLSHTGGIFFTTISCHVSSFLFLPCPVLYCSPFLFIHVFLPNVKKFPWILLQLSCQPLVPSLLHKLDFLYVPTSFPISLFTPSCDFFFFSLFPPYLFLA